MREVAPEIDPARTPRLSRKAGYLEDQLPLFLRQCGELLPIREVQLGDGGVRGQRSGVNDPGIRSQAQQPIKETLAQFLAPEALQVPVPQERKEHLLLEERLRRRGQADPFCGRQVEQGFRAGHISEVKQLKEAIDRVAIGGGSKLRVLNLES